MIQFNRIFRSGAIRTVASFLLFALPLSGKAELPANFQRGLCLEGGPALQECHVDELKGLGATHVSLNPFGWMAAPDEPSLSFARGNRGGSQGRWWGEGDAGLAQYAQAAHNCGMQVMLRPHIWLRSKKDKAGRDNLWLADIGFDNRADWDQFFDQYRAFILQYAAIAQANEMEWLSVGAELTRTTKEHPEQWRRIIAEIRAVYHGKLIYSGNHWEEVEGILFWDDLDAIGVQAYFPIAAGDDATEEQLVEGWRPHLKMLSELSAKYGKPVIFTEVGYRSSPEAAIRPWEWQVEGDPNPELQAKCYRATFRAVSEFPAIQGMYWWKYHVGDCGQLNSPRHAASFTWQGKIAETILREYYGKVANAAE